MVLQSVCWVRFCNVGNVLLLCKGAETAIFERVADGDVEIVERHVNDFAVVRIC